MGARLWLFKKFKLSFVGDQNCQYFNAMSIEKIEKMEF